MDAAIWIYPWDLMDEGIENVLQALADLTGVDGLSVATSYHAGRFLLPHNPKRKVYYPVDGTVYFRPRLQAYGRIQPLVNPLVEEADVLEQTIAAAHRRGMQVHGWTVLLHNAALGAQFPDCTMRNAYGDPVLTNLCPANPDVRHYAVTLLADLVHHYPLASLELESLEYGGFGHGFHHEKFHMRMSPLTQFLLSLCFCQSCIQEARRTGLDMEAIRHHVRSYLDDVFARGGDTEEEQAEREALAGRVGGQLGGLLDMRVEIVLSLLRQALQEAGRHGPTTFIPLVQADRRSWQSGLEAARTSQATGWALVLAYTSQWNQFQELLSQAGNYLDPDVRLVVGLLAGYPAVNDPDELADRVRLCREAGAVRVNFYNYGLIPARNLPWIGQALGRPSCP